MTGAPSANCWKYSTSGFGLGSDGRSLSMALEEYGRPQSKQGRSYSEKRLAGKRHAWLGGEARWRNGTGDAPPFTRALINGGLARFEVEGVISVSHSQLMAGRKGGD